MRADRIGEGSPSQPRASRHHVAFDLRHLDHRVASRDPGSIVQPGTDQVPEAGLWRVGAVIGFWLGLLLGCSLGLIAGCLIFLVFAEDVR